jgi:photosystem II stability/assembly factor-like uncharacterized protein
VFHAVKDDDSIFAAANHGVYGATVQRSGDGGKTWERSEGLGLPEDHELTLEKTWHVEPGSDGTLWLGGAPGVLFRSDDRGESWDPVLSLIDHSTRERWNPGAGGMCTHSIQVDPADPQTMYVGISAAGVFRSEDGGGSWTPKNKGTAADFMEDDRFPEVGQCVHKVLLHAGQDGRLWQQNHCGVYRSDDHGASWERLEGNGLPSGFGFGLALDPNDPDRAFVIPEEGAENRVTCDGRLGIYATADAGASWELTVAAEPAWAAVLREGMSSDAEAVYAGSQSGHVYALRDGEVVEAARHLPPILSVEAAPWQ